MTGNLGAGWALFSPTFPILELPGALPLTLRVPPFFIPAHSRSEILSLQCSFPHERHRYLIHAFPRSICTLEEKLRGALCLNQSPDGLLRNSRHWQALVSSQNCLLVTPVGLSLCRSDVAALCAVPGWTTHVCHCTPSSAPASPHVMAATRPLRQTGRHWRPLALVPCPVAQSWQTLRSQILQLFAPSPRARSECLINKS